MHYNYLYMMYRVTLHRYNSRTQFQIREKKGIWREKKVESNKK